MKELFFLIGAAIGLAIFYFLWISTALPTMPIVALVICTGLMFIIGGVLSLFSWLIVECTKWGIILLVILVTIGGILFTFAKTLIQF
jgi:hypothetical protein